MRRTLLVGMAAGAVGTVALDVSTYLDMVVRARPAAVAGRMLPPRADLLHHASRRDRGDLRGAGQGSGGHAAGRRAR
jgi:hypothetical protein